MKWKIEKKNQIHKKKFNYRKVIELQSKKKSKSKEWGLYLKKITNHNYGPYDDIENKLKYEKGA